MKKEHQAVGNNLKQIAAVANAKNILTGSLSHKTCDTISIVVIRYNNPVINLQKIYDVQIKVITWL